MGQIVYIHWYTLKRLNNKKIITENTFLSSWEAMIIISFTVLVIKFIIHFYLIKI